MVKFSQRSKCFKLLVTDSRSWRYGKSLLPASVVISYDTICKQWPQKLYTPISICQNFRRVEFSTTKYLLVSTVAEAQGISMLYIDHMYHAGCRGRQIWAPYSEPQYHHAGERFRPYSAALSDWGTQLTNTQWCQHTPSILSKVAHPWHHCSIELWVLHILWQPLLRRHFLAVAFYSICMAFGPYSGLKLGGWHQRKRLSWHQQSPTISLAFLHHLPTCSLHCYMCNSIQFMILSFLGNELSWQGITYCRTQLKPRNLAMALPTPNSNLIFGIFRDYCWCGLLMQDLCVFLLFWICIKLVAGISPIFSSISQRPVTSQQCMSAPHLSTLYTHMDLIFECANIIG